MKVLARTGFYRGKLAGKKINLPVSEMVEEAIVNEINILKQKAGKWTAPPAWVEGILCAALQCSDPIHRRTYKNEIAYKTQEDAERDKQSGLQELTDTQRNQRDVLLGQLESFNGGLVELPAAAWLGVFARMVQEIVAKPMRAARLAALDCTPNPYSNYALSVFSFANKRSVDVVLGTRESISSRGIHQTLLMCGRAMGGAAGPLVGAAVKNDRPVSEILRLMALALSGDTIRAAGQLNYANSFLAPKKAKPMNFHQPSDETFRSAKDWIDLVTNASLALRCLENAAAIDALPSSFRDYLLKVQQTFQKCFDGGSVDEEATRLLAILSVAGISQNQPLRTLDSVSSDDLADLADTWPATQLIHTTIGFLASSLFSVFFREFELAETVIAASGNKKQAIQLLAPPTMKMGSFQMANWRMLGDSLHNAEFQRVMKPFR